MMQVKFSPAWFPRASSPESRQKEGMFCTILFFIFCNIPLSILRGILPFFTHAACMVEAHLHSMRECII